MARGGARNRSGPQPNPDSARSDRRGYALTTLPTTPYTGAVPQFPLPAAEDADVAAREAEVWRWVWTIPQAHAWALPSEAWRIPTLAMWVRVRVRCEAPEAPATLYPQLHRFADQVGLTTAGLAEMGWRIDSDADEVEQGVAPEADPAPPAGGSRLRLVQGATG